MSIQLLPQPLPANVIQALNAGLPAFSRSANAAAQVQLMNVAQGGAGGSTYEVFTTGISGVMQGPAGMPNQPAGWRVATRVGLVNMAADIYTVPRGGASPVAAGTPRLACVQTGTVVERMLLATVKLTRWPDGQPVSGQYIARLLILPGLFTESIWLVPPSDDATQSLLVPYHTLVRGFAPDMLYTPSEFFALIRPVAEYWKDRPRLHKPAVSTSSAVKRPAETPSRGRGQAV